MRLSPSAVRADLRASRTAFGARLDAVRRRVDDARVREHLRRAERDLRTAERPELSAVQRRRRRTHLDRLRDYRRRGEFPTNDVASRRTPYFVGANGVPCAVAHLLLAGGETDLVADVAAADPTVRIEDVDDGPLLDWLERNGLTGAEAARIQPTYPYSVQFATTCGPLPCWLAGALASVAGLAAFAAAEFVGYRLVGDLFPDNALKRRAALGYVTVFNLFLLPVVALLLYALFP